MPGPGDGLLDYHPWPVRGFVLPSPSLTMVSGCVRIILFSCFLSLKAPASFAFSNQLSGPSETLASAPSPGPVLEQTPSFTPLGAATLSVPSGLSSAGSSQTLSSSAFLLAGALRVTVWHFPRALCSGGYCCREAPRL